MEDPSTVLIGFVLIVSVTMFMTVQVIMLLR